MFVIVGPCSYYLFLFRTYAFLLEDFPLFLRPLQMCHFITFPVSGLACGVVLSYPVSWHRFLYLDKNANTIGFGISLVQTLSLPSLGFLVTLVL